MEWIETVMGLLSFVGVGLFVYNLIADRKDGDAEDKDDDDVTNFEKLQYLESTADFAVKAAEQLGKDFDEDDKKAYAYQVVEGLLKVLEVEHEPALVDAAVRKAYYDLPSRKFGFLGD